MTTRLEQIKARLENGTKDEFLAHAPADLGAGVRLAEAAERWEDAWRGDDRGSLAVTTNDLLAYIRAFREGAE